MGFSKKIINECKRTRRFAFSYLELEIVPFQKKPENSNWLCWAELITRSGNFQLVAAHDVSEDSIKRIIDRGYLKPSQTYLDLDAMLIEVKCDAIRDDTH